MCKSLPADLNLHKSYTSVSPSCRFGRKYVTMSFWEANWATIQRLREQAMEARAGKFVNYHGSMIWEGLNAAG